MEQGPLCCCSRMRMGRQGLREEQGWDGRWLWEVLGSQVLLLLPRPNEERMWEGEFTVATECSNSLLKKPWAFPWQWRGCHPSYPLQWQCMVGCFATPTVFSLISCPNVIPRDVMSHCGQSYCPPDKADEAELSSSHAWRAWDLLRSAKVANFEHASQKNVSSR